MIGLIIISSIWVKSRCVCYEKLVFNEATITGSIYKYIFDLLSKNPSGIQWKELDALIQQEFPDYHPKTINGCIWKLTGKYAEYVHKPEKGRFQLLP